VERPVFYYDVGSPWCWLAAERLGGGPEWVPVRLGESPAVDRAELERRAADDGLPTVVWPEPFPFDSRTAMLAATFAKEAGRAVAFSLAAMRQAFLAGRDLSVVDNVLIAAAACELHPRAVLKGIGSARVAAGLEAASARVAAAGVVELPTVVVGDRAWAGTAAIMGAPAGSFSEQS
jgi:2-hydroxychromene-2-carboxylate isomerase